MRYRTLGGTDMAVSEIGFGAWGIGGNAYGGADRQESLRTLARAEELGCNFVDTAGVYGDSEAVLGEFLRGRRDKWLISTKFSAVPRTSRICTKKILPCAPKCRITSGTSSVISAKLP